MAEPTEQAPEAPAPPAEDKKITKPKSPGRVAAGKKVAEMNRKNKAKKQEKIEEPSASENWDINPGYVIGGLGLAIAAGSLYLQWKSSHAKPAKTPPVAEEPMPAPKPKSRIPEME